MSRIRIVIDREREWDPVDPNVVEVADEDDYLAARRRMRTEPVTIWVTSDSLARRFDDLRFDPLTDFIQYDPRQELAEALDVSGIPEIISKELIHREGLIAAARREKRAPDETLLAWTLRTILGPPWGKEQLSKEDVAGVLGTLATDGERVEALRELLEWQLRVWGQNSYAAELWRWLAESPAQRARCLWACWMTKGYGDVRLQWLTQEGYQPDDINQADSLLPLLPSSLQLAPGGVSARIMQLVQSELSSCLEKTGIRGLPSPRARFVESLAAVRDHLVKQAKGGEGLTPDDVRSVTEWAEGYRSTPLGDQLLFLAEMMELHPLPARLRTDATWAEASRWLERGYLPAYRSRCVCERLGETRELVQSFEHWLMDNYRRLMMQDEAGLHWFTAGVGDEAQDAAIVLLILDGLPHALVEWLRAMLLAEAPLQVAREQTFLSLLPTTTHTNRPSLLSGRLPDSTRTPDEDVGDEGRASMTLIREPVLPLAILQNLQPGERAVYHWVVADQELLHKPMASVERWLRAQSAVRELARSLAKFAEDAERRSQRVWLGCINDHGWTELPSDAQAVPLPPELTECIAHGRLLKGVTAEQYGLSLDAAGFFLSEPYTVAPDYTYYGTRPHGAVHGGATPQEVAVSGWWVTNGPVEEPLDLGVELVGSIRRAVTANQAVLRLHNPNQIAVEVLQVELVRLTIREPTLPLSINSGGIVQIKVNCDASGVQDALRVEGKIRWRVRNRSKSQEVHMQVATVGAAETDRDFESMFDV